MQHHSRYRSDIDGLRAASVISVVFYHLNVKHFSGGFVGVDVFFVISGYLITSIITASIDKKTFSIRSFYVRRLKRIVPAAALVIFFSLTAGYFLLTPLRLSELGESALFSSVGLANIYFFRSSGYFAHSAESIPLLHFWSLGVEEQFYLIWPFLIIVISRFGRSIRKSITIVILVVVAASFAWSCLAIRESMEQAFFLPHLRTWELGLGALISVAPAIRGKSMSRLLDLGGVLLLAYAVNVLTSQSLFPGPNALWPCIGAALLIWPKEKTIVSTTLSLKPVAELGRLSYSLYLWHWPVIVFARTYNSGLPFSRTDTLVILALSLALAFVSYWYVETPLRSGGTLRAAAVSAACLAGSILVGYLMLMNGGFPGRFPPNLQTVVTYRYSTPPLAPGMCDLTQIRSKEIDKCFTGGNRPKVLIIGDSHAGHFLPALPKVFPEIDFAEAYSSGCRPVIDPKGIDDCVNLMKWVYGEAVPSMNFDVVVLSARWSNADDWHQLPASITALRQHVPQVMVFGQTVEYLSDLPELILSSQLPRRHVIAPRDQALTERMSRLNNEIERLAVGAGASFRNPISAICQASFCQVQTADGTPIEHDYGHLTPEGADLVLSSFRSNGLFADILATGRISLQRTNRRQIEVSF